MLRWTVFGAALLLLVAHGSTLLGGAYARYAERHLDRPRDPSVVEAAALATRLSPWAQRRLALAGWIATEADQPEIADAYYRRALRWAPGDPLLWAEYAQARSRRGHFDAATLAATQQALYLAPTSAAVQHAIAAIGLSYWRRGTPELHAAWQRALRYELDHNRGQFLQQVLRRGQSAVFCADLAARVGEQRWCSAVGQKPGACGTRDSAEGDTACADAQ